MARALWKGSISFGLVTIPVALYPAVTRNELAFKLLDRRDFAPVHEERKNARGEDVPWDEVVKGYEYAGGAYVVLTNEDFRRANVEATQTIDIMQFTDASEIDTLYYDTPYYLEPEKPGRKAYALLRETLAREGKVGVAKVVIRTRQHVAIVRPDGDVLICELLRWPHEIRDVSALDLPHGALEKLGVSKQEVEMASQLVGAMVAKWDPAAYADTYRDDILAMIDDKVASGQTHVITEPSAEEAAVRPAAEVVDIMSLLKRSLEEQKAGGRKAAAPGGGRGDGAGASGKRASGARKRA